MDELAPRRELAATLYPLTGLERTQYRFRVLRIRENIPFDNYRPIRLQRWADHLWRKLLRCPVYTTSRFEFPAFLIPEGERELAKAELIIRDVPDKIYHVDTTDQVVVVTVDEATGPERDLVCRMLEKPFTERFLALRDKFWRAEWTLFHQLVPENEKIGSDIVNAYRGLKFGVVLLEGQGPHLAADIRTRYVGRKPLSAYTEEEKRATLSDHLDLDLRTEDRASFLRDNKAMKVPCRYAGETGKLVGECTFNASGETVLGYYHRMYPDLAIGSDEPAVYVQDRNDDTSRPVPISRLFPIFTNDFEGLRQCSTRPQITPRERHKRVLTFLSDLGDVRYEDRPVKIREAYLSRPRTVFVPPSLEFGQGEKLVPFPKGIPPRSSELFDSLTVKWGSRKMPRLYQAGPHSNEPIPDVVLLYPQTIDRPTRETFLKDLAEEINKQTKRQIQVIQQRAYAIGSHERMGSALLQAAAEVRVPNARVLVIVVLWEKFSKSVHGDLKEIIKPALSQCVTERVVRSIASRTDPQQAASRVRNLALAVLTEAGVKPWVLAEPLRHDLYIGIDVLFGRVGFQFLYGTGGRIMMSQLGEFITRGRTGEAIKRPELRKCLEPSIRKIVRDGHQVRSMVIHRDGRWWPGESAGLRETLKRLRDDGTIPADFRWAVLEIRKNHMPVRLFTAVGNDGEGLLNPLPGTYLVLDRQRALLTTTGRPGAWDSPRGRTAGTLLLEVMESSGDVGIEDLAEDAYRLTHLNWNSPDIEIGLPVTIRWNDDTLRETFRSPAEEESDEDLEVDGEDPEDASVVLAVESEEVRP